MHFEDGLETDSAHIVHSSPHHDSNVTVLADTVVFGIYPTHVNLSVNAGMEEMLGGGVSQIPNLPTPGVSS